MTVAGDKSLPEPDYSPDEFIWSLTEEPHATRRVQILKAHPEIRKLFGPEPRTKYIVFGLIALQITCAYLLRDMVFTWQFFLTAYVIGATTAQALSLAIHEISHFLAEKVFWHNKALMIFANLTHTAPYALTFRGYHLEHHKFQGVDGIDTDLPSPIEARLFRYKLGKLFFLSSQWMFYIFRPMFIRFQPHGLWHHINTVVQIAFDIFIVYNFGWGMIAYFLTSIGLSLSLHPTAGHFIAEHYVFVGQYETYSYYGILNYVTFNVGYHNEHHDFPNIPWSRLPALRKMAPEFYETIPQHESWIRVMWDFVMQPNVGVTSRVKRLDKDNIRSTVCGMALRKND